MKDLTQENINDSILKIYNFWRENPEKFRKLRCFARNYLFENYSFDVEINSFKKLINKITKEN